jgi:hypothetical protein
MKTRFTFYAIVLVAMFFGSFTSYSQAIENHTVNDQQLFLNVDDLTVENYQELYRLMKPNTDYEIVYVCVPAKIVIIKSLTFNDAGKAFTGVKALMSSVQIKAVSVAEGATIEQFYQKCQSTRYLD